MEEKHINEFIEENGFTNVAEDTFECPGGHVWHIDEIRDLWHQETCEWLMIYWINEKL